MAEPLNETSALCMDCGLCCNGAIYDNAPVKPDELEFAIAGGFDIIDYNGGKAFRLPCKYLCGAACTVYEKPRPFVCGDYFCRLATRLTDGEIDFAEAEARVKAVQATIEQIRPLMLEGEDITAARNRWKAMKPGTSTGDDARFSILMAALNRQIDRYFRYSSQVIMRPQSADDEAETGLNAGDDTKAAPTA